VTGLFPGIPVRRGATRLRVGLGRPENWKQLIKFCAVGGSGYVVNLTIFTLLTGGLHAHHVVAATVAFLAAVNNNFWCNRHWTFGARDGRASFQAGRFLGVSVAAFLVSVSLLDALVRLTELPAPVAQAIAIACATPLNFVASKMWSFGRGVPRRVGREAGSPSIR
jgi:dolichol-phosphate mannosyltransferase